MALILNLLSFPLEVPLCVCASYLKNFWFGSGTSSLPSFPRFSFCLAYSDFFLKWHTCSNFLDVCTLKLHMNMLLLFMICGHTSLLLFILSYNDNEYKTLWKCQNQTDLKNCFIKKYFKHNTKQAWGFSSWFFNQYFCYNDYCFNITIKYLQIVIILTERN